MADKQEVQDRLTREAIADVDAGRAIDHQIVLAWAESLSVALAKKQAPTRQLQVDRPDGRNAARAVGGCLASRTLSTCSLEKKR